MAPHVTPLSNPPAESVFFPALGWVESVLLGTVGTTIGIIAMASIGFMMLSGRFHLRRSITMVVGCSLLFGTSVIAAGIRSSLWDTNERIPTSAAILPDQSLIDNAIEAVDPHAGASVRVQYTDR